MISHIPAVIEQYCGQIGIKRFEKLRKCIAQFLGKEVSLILLASVINPMKCLQQTVKGILTVRFVLFLIQIFSSIHYQGLNACVESIRCFYDTLFSLAQYLIQRQHLVRNFPLITCLPPVLIFRLHQSTTNNHKQNTYKHYFESVITLGKPLFRNQVYYIQ